MNPKVVIEDKKRGQQPSLTLVGDVDMAVAEIGEPIIEREGTSSRKPGKLHFWIKRTCT